MHETAFTVYSKGISSEPTQKYKLRVNAFGLILEEEDEILAKWQLEFIRKYGVTKSDCFVIVAGGQCETGEGTFEFFYEDAKLIMQSCHFEIQKKFQMKQRSMMGHMKRTNGDI